jgi:hypothetical protein
MRGARSESEYNQHATATETSNHAALLLVRVTSVNIIDEPRWHLRWLAKPAVRFLTQGFETPCPDSGNVVVSGR